MYSKKEREDYNKRRDYVCKNLGITKNEYNYLRRIGAELHGIYEDNCNGNYSEQEYNNITIPLYEKAGKYARKLGLYIYYQTDPRGATIYVDTIPIPQNSYTNATCIY